MHQNNLLIDFVARVFFFPDFMLYFSFDNRIFGSECFVGKI